MCVEQKDESKSEGKERERERERRREIEKMEDASCTGESAVAV